MRTNLITNRLNLDPLTAGDAPFIMELVNTHGWIQFIGDRHIHSLADAAAYISKINDNPDIVYLVVRLRTGAAPVGIISFIKRDYLPHHDIGFAFLDAHKAQGYAFEAASAVLNEALQDPAHDHILATTIKDNSRSIRLLEKLGFSFHNEIIHEQDTLFVFSIAAER
jgi:[ribosomal protein S5]-alanine N-acetyltransferase